MENFIFGAVVVTYMNFDQTRLWKEQKKFWNMNCFYQWEKQYWKLY